MTRILLALVALAVAAYPGLAPAAVDADRLEGPDAAPTAPLPSLPDLEQRLAEALPADGFEASSLAPAPPPLPVVDEAPAFTLSPGAAAAAPTVASLALSALLAKFVGAFYSRIPAARVLDHPTRRSLLDLVRAEPGITMQDAQARLGIGWGTLVHHVQRLQDEAMLVTEKGHGRRLYAAGSVPPAERAKRAVLAGDTTSRIADYVAAHPGVAQKDMCDALSVAPSVASKHLAKLRSAGLVTELREWRTVRYFPAGSPHPLLAETQPHGPAAA